MSKNSNAEKQKRRTTAKHNRPRRGARKNPAFGSVPIFTAGPGLLSDPILLHHIAGFILRTMELYTPPFKAGMGDYPGDSFIVPEGVTPKSEVQ